MPEIEAATLTAAETMTNVMIAIASYVTEYHDVTPDQVHQTKPLAQRCYRQAQPDEVAMVRHVTAYLLRHVAGWRLEQVGDAMGRHHTTIMHSVDKIQYRIDRDNNFRKAIEKAVLKAAGPCILFKISPNRSTINVDDIIQAMADR